MMQSVLVAVFLLSNAEAAFAAGVNAAAVSVKPPDGVKLGDEDVFVVWADDCTRSAKAEKKIELLEEGFLYKPRALVARVGQVLSVRNADKIQHNSFALKNVAFDSGLQKPATAYDVKLEKPGVTKVFCRIHPKMVSEVLVLKGTSCFQALRGEELSGKKFSLAGAKAGKVWLWSPRLKEFHSIELEKDLNAEFKLAKSDFLETVAAPASSTSMDRDAGY